MWEVTFTLSPDRGYFDAAEPLMWDADIWLRSIHGIEFLSDDSVAIVYEVEGDVDRLLAAIDDAENRWIKYTVTRECEPTVIKLRFFPDETLQRIFEIQRSFGVSIQFPIEYVGYDPVVLEVTEFGSEDELRDRIQATRDVARVEIQQLHPYQPGTTPVFQELTDRQQEVLLTAIEKGYYRCPKEATQEEIADELGCSASVVGQHLRRIESALVASAVPGGSRVEQPPRSRTD